MAKYVGELLGHRVVAELSELTASYYVDVDGVRRADGAQVLADQNFRMDLDGHLLLIRFHGKVMGHIEDLLDNKVVYSA